MEFPLSNALRSVHCGKDTALQNMSSKMVLVLVSIYLETEVSACRKIHSVIMPICFLPFLSFCA